ncbi:MAG: hypothetical protein KF763_18620 [Cyclobacteriaceae bacterium]|nr:hypothetical protein [Cyclobacteriaceae bacterium]
MKTSLFILLCIVSVPAICQDDEALSAPRALFKTVPQSFMIKTLKVGVEVFNESRTKSYSLYVSGRLDGNNGSPVFYYDDDFYQGVGAEFQYRKYLNGFTPWKTRRDREYVQGVYIGGYVTGGTFSNKGEFTTHQRNFNTGQITSTAYYLEDYILNYGAGFTIGYHRTFWKVLFFDAYVGGGAQLSKIDRNYDLSRPEEYYVTSYQGIASPGYQGIMPKFGIAVGIAL